MKNNPFELKNFFIALISLLVVLLYLPYNKFNQRDLSQREYDAWFEIASQRLNKFSTINDSGKVSITLESQILPGLLKLTSDSEEKSEKILRLLQMIKDLNFFSTQTVTKDPEQEIKANLVIKDGMRSFKKKLTGSEINLNIRTQMLIKLLQVYANDPEGVVAHDQNQR